MAIKTPCAFTYRHFREILEVAVSVGYRFSAYGIPSDERTKEVILRHDVDLDLGKAVEMATAEADQGVVANFFLQLSSPYYNLFNKETRAAAIALLQLGHHVGLHFDARAYDPNVDLQSAILAEAAVLSECLRAPVRIMSFHRPSPDLLGLEINGIISAYSPPYFSGMKYISDSVMVWRSGCLCKNIGVEGATKIQALIHPIWWSNAGATDVAGPLESLLAQRTAAMQATMIETIRPYNPFESKTR